MKRCVFIVFLKQFVVIANLSSFGKLFHRIAAPVSIRRLPYRTDLYLFGIIDVVLADLKGRFGWYQFSKYRINNDRHRDEEHREHTTDGHRERPSNRYNRNDHRDRSNKRTSNQRTYGNIITDRSTCTTVITGTIKATAKL